MSPHCVTCKALLLHFAVMLTSSTLCTNKIQCPVQVCAIARFLPLPLLLMLPDKLVKEDEAAVEDPEIGQGKHSIPEAAAKVQPAFDVSREHDAKR